MITKTIFETYTYVMYPKLISILIQFIGGRVTKSSESIQTELTMAEITKRSTDLDARNNRIDELQRMNDEMSRHLTGRNKELESSKSTITKCLAVVKELLIEKSRIERKDARAKCMQNRLRYVL